MIVQNHGSLSLPKPVVRKIAKRMRNRQYGAFLVVADGGNYEIYDAPLETNHHSVLIDPPQYGEQPQPIIQPVVQVPTGGGKTVIELSLIHI